MAKLSTSAWVLHDLGLAAGFGGPLFGKIALGQAARQITSREERDRVLQEAWKKFNLVDAVSLATAGLTWLTGRSMISGRVIDRGARRLVLLKDVLVGGAILTGVANMFASAAMEQAVYGEGEAPREHKQELNRFFKVMGPLNIAFVAGAIGVTALLAMKSGRSAKWAALSRFLP